MASIHIPQNRLYIVLEVGVKMTHDGSCVKMRVIPAACGGDVSITTKILWLLFVVSCGYGAMIDEANCPPTLPCRKKTLQKRFSIIFVVKDLCNNWWSYCGHHFILVSAATNQH